MPTHYKNYDEAANKLIARIGKTIFIGIPLGLGKPIGLVNALYRLAVKDPSINLTILTALTLSRPRLHNVLEQRLVTPILDRLLKDYEEPLYEHPRELQQLPDNIKVIEFFLTPGKYLHNDYVQQNYISSKYTSVVQDTLAYPINVLANQVARSKSNPEQYSLSCNPDVFHEVAVYLKALWAQGKPVAVVAEVNDNLPFMLGDAAIGEDTFTDIIDTGHYRSLFALPRDEIPMRDHLIGLYTSTLIKDDGCLQIGIGKISNAVANALIMRHHQNNVYQEVLNNELKVNEKFADTITKVGSLLPFEKGLYASTEMLSDEYIELYKAGILKKQVYDHIGLQYLLNTGQIDVNVTPELLATLVDNHLVNSQLTLEDIQFLKKFGIFKTEVNYVDGYLQIAGASIAADLSAQKKPIAEKCLGNRLQSGKLVHAGFFIGSVELYRYLKNMPYEELAKIDMTTVSKTNTLLWSYELAKLQRKNARFVNTAMMITLGGAYVSDGLKGLQEVSGVGGQFDFVNMAHSLRDARSIINCHSVIESNHKINSNIVFSYPNMTIPRYLRDIIVTEYGIADCRSKTDAEVIKAILNITDSRFQPKLLKMAKSYGKLPVNYEIPTAFQNNYPQAIQPLFKQLQLKGYCKPYPFGSDLTAEEQLLAKSLLFLKKSRKYKLLLFIVLSLFKRGDAKKFEPYLTRMQLNQPKNIKDFIYKKLLIFTIAKQLPVAVK